MIVLDTSGLLALLDRDDPDHRACSEAMGRERAPYLVPGGILGELGYLVERKLDAEVLAVFLEDLAAGAFELDCGIDDLGRIAALVRRYADLGLGLADASVVACAERSGGRVLTLDRRHFDVVAGEGRITLALDEET